MAIRIRSETSGTGVGNASSQMTVTAPATIGIGDFIVVIMGAGDDAPSLAAPVGWVEGDRNGSSTGNDRQIGIWYKGPITNPAAETTYTWTAGNLDECAWWIGSLAGVNPVTPQDEAMSGNIVNFASNTVNCALTAITTVTPGAFVLAAWANNYYATVTMPPTDWDTRVDDKTNVTVNLCVASRTFAAVGSTGTPTVALDGTAECSGGQWAFRPKVNQVRTVMVGA